MKLKEAEVARLRADLETYVNRVRMSDRNMEEIRENSRNMHEKRMEEIKK